MPEPLKYTKLGGPKSWKLRKPPVLRTFVSGRLCGADPPLIYAIPPTCSLLPKLLPSCLFHAPESACGVGGVGGPWFLCVFIIHVYICKNIFFKYMCLFTTSQAVCSLGPKGQYGGMVGVPRLALGIEVRVAATSAPMRDRCVCETGPLFAQTLLPRPLHPVTRVHTTYWSSG